MKQKLYAIIRIDKEQGIMCYNGYTRSFCMLYDAMGAEIYTNRNEAKEILDTLLEKFDSDNNSIFITELNKIDC